MKWLFCSNKPPYVGDFKNKQLFSQMHGSWGISVIALLAILLSKSEQ
jgi:hypothetical protein